MIIMPSSVMEPYVCLVFCKHQRGQQSLCWASEGEERHKSVVPLDAAGCSVSDSPAGTGTESIPLGKAHVAQDLPKDSEDRAMAQRCCAAKSPSQGQV